MLKSCWKCGRIHDKSKSCNTVYKQYVKPEVQTSKSQFPKEHYVRSSDADRFRGSIEWKQKRESIRKRDLYLCRECLKNGRYCSDIQVHHITPLSVDYNKRLDGDNLICLCSYHHELAESGRLSADHLRELAQAPPE